MDSVSSAGKQQKKPSDTYLCKRCNVPGHWLTQCPTNLDPSFDTVPLRLRCPLCGAVGKHLMTLCPKNKDSKSLNQRRILAGVSSKNHHRESRRERHRLRISSNKSSSKGEGGLSRSGDRGRSRGRGHDQNLEHTRERSRSRSQHIRVREGPSRRRDRSVPNHSGRSSPQDLGDFDDSKHDGLQDWKENYGPMNAERARMMQSGARDKSRGSKRRSSTKTPEMEIGSEYAVYWPENEESRRSPTVSPPQTHAMSDRCGSPESSDQQAGFLHMNIALRSRQPQQPDETVIDTDRILESVEQYITAQFNRETASGPKNAGPQDRPVVEPVMGTRHPLDCYSAAARGLILRFGLGNPWVNYTKRRRALDLWDKKEQVMGVSRARRMRTRCITYIFGQA
ncbi:hypothetical protein MCOR25_005636 [Pyricularia grisea]|nr:hypothetical protein MCOR25_005636 [Pyricularia grisea]